MIFIIIVDKVDAEPKLTAFASHAQLIKRDEYALLWTQGKTSKNLQISPLSKNIIAHQISMSCSRLLSNRVLGKTVKECSFFKNRVTAFVNEKKVSRN